MFKPLSLYIGLRYIRAKRRNRFISFISLVSMLGIALGIAVLITVVSVMNGFDKQIRLKIFAMTPHITISGLSGKLSNWQAVSEKASKFTGVLGAVPYVRSQGLLTNNNLVRPIVVSGVSPDLEGHVSDIGHKVIQGSWRALKPHQFGIVLGDALAENLGVGVGDKVTLVTTQMSVTPIGVVPRFKRFKVVGIFHVGAGLGYDNSVAFVNLKDAQILFMLGDQVSGIQLKIRDLFAAQRMSLGLQKYLGFDYQISNWTDQYGAFYHAVQMEKTIMFFILLLLIAIAAFNLVSGLVMLVNDKRTDIAILRTFGATPRVIMSIFLVQGCMIGFIGTILGVIGGTVLSLNVTRIVNFIQSVFHVQLLTANVYWVNYLPSQLQLSDIIHVSIAAFMMSLIATLYPAWRAARTRPVEALRYE